MPKVYIERSIPINAPAPVVYAALNDFNKWVKWSPWLIMEPSASVDVAEDAKSYTWDGYRVGSGNMKVREERENEHIHFDLNFLKPWKSSNTTSFYLTGTPEGTVVKWTMDTSLPFYLFWMKKMMGAWVGADYERGLDMLKAYVEQGEIHSKLDFKGNSEFDGCKWIGIKAHCLINDMAIKMPEDFERIWKYADENDENIDGEAFTIYHKWNIVKGKVSYTAALPVKEISPDLPEGFVSGQIPQTPVYILGHTGAYKHLGNAWSTLYAMHRNKEFKPRKGVHPFEIYKNDPKITPEKDLLTEICFPISQA